MSKLISFVLPPIFLLLVMIFGVVEIKKQNTTKDEIIDSLSVKIIKADSIEVNTMEYLPFGLPLDTIDISSEYGLRRNPKHGGWEIHPGLDMKGLPHDTVYATGSGVITTIGNCGGYGKCIVIDHIDGIQSRYAHMNKIFRRKNKLVKKGDPLGTVGKTGYATGYHLHYEVMKDSVYMNPLKWMKVENEIN